MISMIIAIVCFVICMALANKTIHKKFNKWGNERIRKMKGR